jgi:hypothetical protein
VISEEGMKDAVTMNTRGTRMITAKSRSSIRIIISMPRENCNLKAPGLIALLIMITAPFNR